MRFIAQYIRKRLHYSKAAARLDFFADVGRHSTNGSMMRFVSAVLMAGFYHLDILPHDHTSANS